MLNEMKVIRRDDAIPLESRNIHRTVIFMNSQIISAKVILPQRDGSVKVAGSRGDV